jgi:hypothetical protein
MKRTLPSKRPGFRGLGLLGGGFALALLGCSPADSGPGNTGNGDGTGGSSATGGKGNSGSSGGSSGSSSGGSGNASGGSTGNGGSTPGAGGSNAGAGGSSGGASGGSSGSGTGGSSGGGTGGSPGAGGSSPPAGRANVVDPPCSDQVDNVAPSINPPGGLPANKVPQFVILGIDDNGHADGIHWMLDDFHNRKNPDGTAVSATFFISGGFASEFFHDDGHQTKDDVLNAWKRIKAEGHEIGNHSWSHADTLQGTDKAGWLAEMNKANDLFVNTLGVEKCKINGFRTPFLAFSQNTFDALKATGMKYDTSVEFGYDWWQPAGSDTGWGPGTAESGKHYYWPFTMDKPFVGGFASKGVGTSPGIWEFAMFTFNKIAGETASTVVGLDYNLWLKCQSEPSFKFAEVLKMSLDQRLAGNHSPLNVGLHSDIYAQWDQDSNMAFSHFTYDQRRAALKEFIDYAQSKPEVRIVTYRQMITWMRDPKPLP